MRSSLPALAAFLSTASAALSGAPAYLLQHTSSLTASTFPSLSAQTARLIFEQRLNTPNVFLSDGIDFASREAAITTINAFGRAPKPLFGGTSSADDTSGFKLDPSQLVVLIEGLGEEEIAEAVAEAQLTPAFEVAEPPSSMANSQLVREHPAAGAGMGCELAEAVNPLSANCWQGASSLVRFDAQKDSSILSTLKNVISKMINLAASGEMESVIVFFPKAATSAKSTWNTAAGELRRRQAAEAVMTENTMATSDNMTISPSINIGTSAKPVAGAIFISGKNVPECFKDAEACTAGTNSCSGNGVCINRWGKEANEACYVCSCTKKTSTGSSASTGYAGKACEKEDYSTPFALFVGFSTVMVGVLAFSISILYQVGQEPLPGVIGAGVVKK